MQENLSPNIPAIVILCCSILLCFIYGTLTSISKAQKAQDASVRLTSHIAIGLQAVGFGSIGVLLVYMSITYFQIKETLPIIFLYITMPLLPNYIIMNHKKAVLDILGFLINKFKKQL